MTPKLKSMLAHLTPVGWLLSLMLNQFKKDEVTSFYLRQSLGLFDCFFITWFIPDYYIFAWGLLFVFWTYSFVGTIKQTEIPVPFLGQLFQKWFSIISCYCLVFSGFSALS